MKVSVIMPVYNISRHNFLNDAVVSFLKQDYKDKELIIINDGSTDNTEEMIRNVKDKHIRCINLEYNGGQGNAQNIGIAESTGELITLLDDDDYLEPGSLSCRADCFKENVDFVCGNYAEVYINKRNIKPICNSQEDAINRIWQEPGVIGTQTLMWRKRLFESVGWFNTEVSSAEDWDWKIRILNECTGYFIPNVVYNYRYHDKMRSALHRNSGELMNNKAKVIKKLKGKYD